MASHITLDSLGRLFPTNTIDQKMPEVSGEEEAELKESGQICLVQMLFMIGRHGDKVDVKTVLLSHQPELRASYLNSVPNLSLLSTVEAC